jgi:hypothetical protein
VTNNLSSAGELSLKPPSRMSFGRAKTQVGMSRRPLLIQGLF